jgi:uncharacterized surface protein with fasciclin (FAS1) repeats
MKNLRIVAIFMLLAGLAFAQEVNSDPAGNSGRDLLSVARSDRSLAMFVAAVQSCGMAKMLRDEGPLTVFALSNRAFANLTKEDRETLLTDRAAMHILLAHYIVNGSVPADDPADLLSARTLVGVKLRTDLRSEGSYVNGAKLSPSEIRCLNGLIHILDSFDPGLVHDAVALAKNSRK